MYKLIVINLGDDDSDEDSDKMRYQKIVFY